MLLDQQNLFSDAQAITASAASTNVIDNGKSVNLGVGQPLGLLIQVVEKFTNLTSLKIEYQVSDDKDFSSKETIASQTILLADLVAGRRTAVQWTPDYQGTYRYERLYYTVTGTAPDAGKITAGFTPEVPNWNAYPGVV